MPTSTVENYLKANLLRSGEGQGEVTTGALADALGVTPGTATTMTKSLASQGLLDYQPREGVRLTAEGKVHALAVLRKHRLIETFLVQVLKMDWKDVHEEAEALEHAISDRVLVLIDELLGHPLADPHGDPIPLSNGALADRGLPVTLATCALGRPLRVERILDQSSQFLEFIQRAGLKPGSILQITERETASGVLHGDLRGGAITMGLPEAAKIEVQLV